MSDDPHNSRHDRGNHSQAAPFNLVRPKRHLNAANIDYLREYVAAAEAGKISAFVICAIGPSLSTWRGYSGGMVLQERVNLIGQLQLLTSALIEIQNSDEDRDKS